MRIATRRLFLVMAALSMVAGCALERALKYTKEERYEMERIRRSFVDTQLKSEDMRGKTRQIEVVRCAAFYKDKFSYWCVEKTMHLGRLWRTEGWCNTTYYVESASCENVVCEYRFVANDSVCVIP